MRNFIDKALVVIKAAPTYLGVLAVVLTALREELVVLLPGSLDETVGGWIAVALGVVAGVIAVIRRVSPVDPVDRGIL